MFRLTRSSPTTQASPLAFELESFGPVPAAVLVARDASDDDDDDDDDDVLMSMTHMSICVCVRMC